MVLLHSAETATAVSADLCVPTDFLGILMGAKPFSHILLLHTEMSEAPSILMELCLVIIYPYNTIFKSLIY
jgi:hypothetical protein